MGCGSSSELGVAPGAAGSADCGSLGSSAATVLDVLRVSGGEGADEVQLLANPHTVKQTTLARILRSPTGSPATALCIGFDAATPSC